MKIFHTTFSRLLSGETILVSRHFWAGWKYGSFREISEAQSPPTTAQVEVDFRKMTTK